MMSTIAADLQVLEELRRAGSLSPDEFERAKARLLTDSAPSPLQEAANERRMRRLELENKRLRVEGVTKEQ